MINDEALENALTNIHSRSSGEEDEQELIRLLASRISELLDENPDLLFSTLYRLDISERKINDVIYDKAFDAPLGLAHLIIDRQREKLLTREKYKNQDPGNWADDLS